MRHDGDRSMRILLAVIASCALAGCASVPGGADPASDAPEQRIHSDVPLKPARSYGEASAVLAERGGRQCLDRRPLRVRHGARPPAVGDPAREERPHADPRARGVLRGAAEASASTSRALPSRRFASSSPRSRRPT
jgi:hypothetical protein